MKQITIDGQEIRIAGSPVALFYYKQEFGSDLVADFIALQKLASEEDALDSLGLLQVVWAMAKAANPKDFPPFFTWIERMEAFDFTDQKIISDIFDEAGQGFFRGGLQRRSDPKRARKTKK